MACLSNVISLFQIIHTQSGSAPIFNRGGATKGGMSVGAFPPRLNHLLVCLIEPFNSVIKKKQ